MGGTRTRLAGGFEYEYHFIEYEYDFRRTVLATCQKCPQSESPACVFRKDGLAE